MRTAFSFFFMMHLLPRAEAAQFMAPRDGLEQPPVQDQMEQEIVVGRDGVPRPRGELAQRNFSCSAIGMRCSECCIATQQACRDCSNEWNRPPEDVGRLTAGAIIVILNISM